MLSAGPFPNNEDDRLDLILRTICSPVTSLAVQALKIEGSSTVSEIADRYSSLSKSTLLGVYMTAMERDIVTRGRNSKGVVYGLSRNAKKYIIPSIEIALNWFSENEIHPQQILGMGKMRGDWNPPYKYYAIVDFLYDTRESPITEREVLINIGTKVCADHFDNLRNAGIIGGKSVETRRGGYFCYRVTKKDLSQLNKHFPKDSTGISKVLENRSEVTRKNFEEAGFDEAYASSILNNLTREGWITYNKAGRHNGSKIYLTETGESLYEKVFEPINRISLGDNVTFDRIDRERFMHIHDAFSRMSLKRDFFSYDKRCKQLLDMIEALGVATTLTLSEKTGLSTAGVRVYMRELTRKGMITESKKHRLFYYSKN